MTQRQINQGIRILDHAIDHLGPTKPCFLMVCDGKAYNVPSTNSGPEAARAVLVNAMLQLVKEGVSE